MLGQYLNLDLLVTRDGNGYQTRVLESPVGQAIATFKFDAASSNLPVRVYSASARGLKLYRVDTDQLGAKKIGEQLFALLFRGDVYTCLTRSIDEADRQDAGLRIRLRLQDAPELAGLPWEYLYDNQRRRAVALSTATPIIRYLELPDRIPPLSVTPPLRILALIASPSDYPPLDVEEEWSRLQTAVSPLVQRGVVRLDRLEPATLSALQRRLRRDMYHIFHFVGHGDFDANSGDGILLLEHDQGAGRAVTAERLGVLLHDHRSLRLAVLNACRGATTSRGDIFAGTAQTLLLQGVPAVVAMQFEITDAAAITLAHQFYAAVADGYPVDASLTEARKALFAQGNSEEWATPVLFMRATDGRIFVREESKLEERMSGAERSQLAAPVVGRIATYLAGATGDTRGRSLYQALKRQLDEESAVGQALADLARTPADDDYQAVLRVQLKKVLADDVALAGTLTELLDARTEPTSGSTTIQQTAGDDATQIGQITGDVTFN